MKNYLNKKSLLFIGMTTSILFAKAQSTILPLDPEVRTGKLNNGFTYYIKHNGEPKNRVYLELVNKVGSVLEDGSQQGLAHFIEHMSFNGTKHFPKSELVNYLQKSGIRFGADLNAYTGFDETVYQLPMPSDNPELLKNGLQIMRDWAQDASLDPVEINKERGVVLEEKRLGKGAQERIKTKYWPVLLNNSRYSVRIPIGTDQVLHNFLPETLRRFYHDWYRPDLQALIVVGDINIDSMENAIKSKFADLKNPFKEKPRTKYSIGLTGENHFITATDKELTSTNIEVIIKKSGITIKTAGDFRLSIIRALYNLIVGDRLAELSQTANPPFLQANISEDAFIGGTYAYDISVVVKPGETERGFKAVWTENERLKRFGFTDSEVQRAKGAYQSGMEANLKEASKTNSESYAQEYSAYFLKGTAAPGIKKEYQITTEALSGITAADLNTFAKKQVTSLNRDIMIMAPEKDKSQLPDEKEILDWINMVNKAVITPYKDAVSKLALLTTQSAGGKIISESVNKSMGLTTIKLSNGITVLLKPTNFKDNEILFSSFSFGGTSLYSDEDFQSASNAGGLISSFGIGNYSKIELGKFLADKEVGVSPYISDRTQGINGAAIPKDFETALQLIYAYYTQPRIDTAIFKGIIDNSKATLANRSSDPSSVFQDTVSAVSGNYNIRRTGPSIEKIDQISLSRALEIYKERFANAGGTVFTFVGNIDTLQIRPLLEKYIGGLPGNDQQPSWKDLNIHFPAGQIVKKVYKGSEPKATVRLVWSGEFNYSDKNALVLDALKECLQIRLLERLREDESAVYSPFATAIGVKFPQQRFAINVMFGCSPANADKLVNSTLDEINKLKTQGPPVVNLEKWKAELLRQMENQILNNSWWLSYLVSRTSNQEDLKGYQNNKAIINSITPEMIAKAASEYISGKNYIKFELLPVQE